MSKKHTLLVSSGKGWCEEPSFYDWFHAGLGKGMWYISDYPKECSEERKGGGAVYSDKMYVCYLDVYKDAQTKNTSKDDVYGRT